VIPTSRSIHILTFTKVHRYVPRDCQLRLKGTRNAGFAVKFARAFSSQSLQLARTGSSTPSKQPAKFSIIPRRQIDCGNCSGPVKSALFLPIVETRSDATISWPSRPTCFPSYSLFAGLMTFSATQIDDRNPHRTSHTVKRLWASVTQKFASETGERQRQRAYEDNHREPHCPPVQAGITTQSPGRSGGSR